jgi:hypothetical protein
LHPIRKAKRHVTNEVLRSVRVKCTNQL